MKPEKSYVRLAFISIFWVVMLQACLGSYSPHSKSETIAYQSGSEPLKDSQQLFASRNPMVKSSIGELELIVRMATMAEIPKELHKMWGIFPLGGAGSLALGLVAAPMYASTLVVGGAFLIPLGTYGYIHEKRIRDSINGALTTAEFTRAIGEAMKGRLNIVFAKEPAPNVKIEITIQAFGIISFSSRERNCFVVSAAFMLSRGNTEVKRDQLQITDANRSADAPPPQCASLEHFAKNEARLVKDTLAEYAEVLAVMAMERIPRQNSK